MIPARRPEPGGSTSRICILTLYSSSLIILNENRARFDLAGGAQPPPSPVPSADVALFRRGKGFGVAVVVSPLLDEYRPLNTSPPALAFSETCELPRFGPTDPTLRHTRCERFSMVEDGELAMLQMERDALVGRHPAA